MRVQVDAMRRVTAFVDAITLLTACSSGDIVVKTDLDEQYIIKESAVTKIPFDWKEVITEQEESTEEWEDMHEKDKTRIADCAADGILSKDWCTSHWSESIRDTTKHFNEAKEELTALKDYKSNHTDENQIIAPIRYRPIFQDINGDKNALGYATTTCLNPKGIGSEGSEKLFEILGMSADDTEKKKTAKESAYLSVTKKVCDRYAFTNTVFFNYTVDEDQDKDKKD